MNFNVNTKTAACDLSRHQEVEGGVGVSRFEVQFIPTSEPHQLESGLQKSLGLPGRSREGGVLAWAPTHQRLLIIQLPNCGGFAEKAPVSCFKTVRLLFLSHSSDQMRAAALFRICLPVSGAVLLFKRLQCRMAAHFPSSLANTSAGLCQSSTLTKQAHHGGKESINCLFTICCGNLLLLTGINNSAVWSEHSTKVRSVHSEAQGGGSHKRARSTWRRFRELSSLSSAAVTNSLGHVFLLCVCTVSEERPFLCLLGRPPHK